MVIAGGKTGRPVGGILRKYLLVLLLVGQTESICGVFEIEFMIADGGI